MIFIQYRGQLIREAFELAQKAVEEMESQVWLFIGREPELLVEKRSTIRDLEERRMEQLSFSRTGDKTISMLASEAEESSLKRAMQAASKLHTPVELLLSEKYIIVYPWSDLSSLRYKVWHLLL